MPTAGVGAGPGGCDAHESTAISWRLDAQQAKRIRHELGLNPISWCETPSPGLENQLAHVCSLSLCCFLRARTRMHHSIACQQDSAGGVEFLPSLALWRYLSRLAKPTHRDAMLVCMQWARSCPTGPATLSSRRPDDIRRRAHRAVATVSLAPPHKRGNVFCRWHEFKWWCLAGV